MSASEHTTRQRDRAARVAERDAEDLTSRTLVRLGPSASRDLAEIAGAAGAGVTAPVLLRGLVYWLLDTYYGDAAPADGGFDAVEARHRWERLPEPLRDAMTRAAWDAGLRRRRAAQLGGQAATDKRAGR